jgi:hypothetical protein
MRGLEWHLLSDSDTVLELLLNQEPTDEDQIVNNSGWRQFGQNSTEFCVLQKVDRTVSPAAVCGCET